MQTLKFLGEIVSRLEPIIFILLTVTAFIAAYHGEYGRASFDLLLAIGLRQRVTE